MLQTPATIHNCWRHTGIIFENNADLEGMRDQADDLQVLLNTSTLLPMDCNSASNYLHIDKELETGELSTDEDIITLVERVDDPNTTTSR